MALKNLSGFKNLTGFSSLAAQIIYCCNLLLTVNFQ